eukprot:4897834-Lingulodinium_polyedra.AAC.1
MCCKHTRDSVDENERRHSRVSHERDVAACSLVSVARGADAPSLECTLGGSRVAESHQAESNAVPVLPPSRDLLCV